MTRFECWFAFLALVYFLVALVGELTGPGRSVFGPIGSFALIVVLAAYLAFTSRKP